MHCGGHILKEITFKIEEIWFAQKVSTL